MEEIDLIPTQVYKLGRPKTVAEGDKDDGGIPVTPAIASPTPCGATISCLAFNIAGMGVMCFAILISFAPAILPRDTDCAKFAASTGCKAGAGMKLQRILAVDRQGERKSGPRIAQLVVALDAIQRGVAARKVDAIQSDPDTRLKRVKEMCLNRIDRRLRKSVAAKEIGIVAKESSRWERPRTSRDPKLWKYPVQA